MAVIKICRNPLDQNDLETHEFNGRVIDFLQEVAPKGFGNPIEVYINAEKIELDDLDKTISGDDICAVCVMPAGEIALAEILINMVIAMAISFVISKVFGPSAKVTQPSFSDQPTPNTVYNLSAKQNAARLGEPIPVVYGEVVNTPDYCSQPYTCYDRVDSNHLSHVLGPTLLLCWLSLHLLLLPGSLFSRSGSPRHDGLDVEDILLEIQVPPELAGSRANLRAGDILAEHVLWHGHRI